MIPFRMRGRTRTTRLMSAGRLEVPVITAPANGATLYNGESITVSATTTDTDLDRIDWVLDGTTVIATDSASPYSQTWAISGLTVGAHTLEAIAYRGGQSMSSGTIPITIANRTYFSDYFFANGTWTSYATFWGPTGNTRNQARRRVFAGGGGGLTNTGAGGGGAVSISETDVSLTPSTGYAVVVAPAGTADTDGADSSFDSAGSAAVIAKGGKSRTNGGTGGAASGGTGQTKYSGGNGQAGTGAQTGGGSAGTSGAGAGTVPGEPDGGSARNSTTNSRRPGSGGPSASGSGGPGAAGVAIVDGLIPATAGYPRIAGMPGRYRTTGAADTNHVIPAPAGTGGRLVLWFVADGNVTFSATGWTVVAQATEASLVVSAGVMTIVSTGSETMTITTSGATRVVAICYRVYNPDGDTAPPAPEVEINSGSSANADPPSLTDSRGSAPTLWLAALGLDSNVAVSVNGFPTNYTQGTVLAPARADGTGTAAAMTWRYATAATENPGAFSNGSEQWVSATISIHPS